MCGIAGVVSFGSDYAVDRRDLVAMADAMKHRGPDDSAFVIDGKMGFAFRRLSIIDVSHGNQPFYSADNQSFIICNGEIYNYRELRDELKAKGYTFKTNCDVEVVIHLYEEYGIKLLDKLNGQFSFAIYDKRKRALFLARDHFGICPLFYYIKDGLLIFASEIKSIIKHPLVRREVNLTGLDQIFSFPGLVSPTTMFKDIHSLKPGHFIELRDDVFLQKEYWDLNYPESDSGSEVKSEQYYVEQLDDLLLRSVRRRMHADVPIGFYLSGGLDSSLIGGVMKRVSGDKQYPSFSIGFPLAADKSIDERKYQRLMAKHLQSDHKEIEFDWNEIEKRLGEAVYCAESPLKESYNTCSLALSNLVRKNEVKVILSGEGADELFGGYVGYRLDKERNNSCSEKDVHDMLEDEMRLKLWGDENFFYERKQYEWKEIKRSIYSSGVNDRYDDFDCLERLEIDKGKLANRHSFNKRSYLDFKLRLSDHLLADHCDRVVYANSVEGRYPFLDIELIEFLKNVPSEVKLSGTNEKYILKQLSKRYLPNEIITREKFGFVAPGSPQLLNKNVAWVDDMLSYDRVKRQGYFDPDMVEHLKKVYKGENFRLNLPFETDMLMIVLTFNLFIDLFEMPDL